MTGKTSALALAGMLLIGGACRAQGIEAGPEVGPGDIGHGEVPQGNCGPAGCGHHGRGLHRRNDDGRTCCQRIWGWWTYRPLPVPHHLKGCIRFQQTPQAPYYAYFVYVYGPRSPNLGFKPTPVHRGEVCAHGLPPGTASAPDGVPFDGPPIEGAPVDGVPGAAPAPEEALPSPRQNDPAPPVSSSETLPKEAPEESEQAPVLPDNDLPVREQTGRP